MIKKSSEGHGEWKEELASVSEQITHFAKDKHTIKELEEESVKKVKEERAHDTKK